MWKHGLGIMIPLLLSFPMRWPAPTAYALQDGSVAKENLVMLLALKRLLAFLGLGDGNQPPDADGDPYARRPVPRKPQPKMRSGAIAVAEPDE